MKIPTLLLAVTLLAHSRAASSSKSRQSGKQRQNETFLDTVHNSSEPLHGEGNPFTYTTNPEMNWDRPTEYAEIMQQFDDQYLDDVKPDTTCQYPSEEEDDEYEAFCTTLENELSREDDEGCFKVLSSSISSPLMGSVERASRAMGKMPTPFVKSLGDTWTDYIPIYTRADQQVTRHQARYRLFTKLTKDIATKLASHDRELVADAVSQLGQVKRKCEHRIGRHRRARLHSIVQKHFNLKSISSASNITGAGILKFPVDRIEELFDDNERVRTPALELLRDLANIEKRRRRKESKRKAVLVEQRED